MPLALADVDQSLFGTLNEAQQLIALQAVELFRAGQLNLESQRHQHDASRVISGVACDFCYALVTLAAVKKGLGLA